MPLPISICGNMMFKQNNKGVFQGMLIALLLFALCYLITPYIFAKYEGSNVNRAYDMVFSLGNIVQEKIYSLSAIGILLPFYFFFKKEYYKQAYGCIFVALVYSIILITLYI